ncbi:peptidoglycan-binding protein [Halomicronema sp. CCY15110]|uniref:peptidoglycan-binding protein n=1 Tax=Halomicronema sp. CCY15110 TaxID=2767773 RepID=UPI00194F1B25|nr:peptidoglycan-binding protein [Halomicronema sp. CCY15110]
MFNRVLLIMLTSAATCGLTTAAIAQDARASTQAWSSGPLMSQATDDQNEDTAQQPSAAVQSLQNRLSELGYYDGSVTGIFDSATREALTQFQQDQGLVGTGILDPLTQERLADPSGAQAAAAADAAAPNAPAASPTLDLPPVSESGEALESEPAPTDAPAAETEDATGTPEGGTTDPAEATTPAEGSGFPLLLVAGAVILVVGGLAGGVALWLGKRQGQRAAPNDAPKTADPTAQPPSPSQSMPTQPEAPAGHSPASPQSPASATQNVPPPSPSPLDNVTESRVTKVNIIDELIQDLEQPDPELRRRAIWELGQRGNSAAMQPLVSLLTQVDSREQSLILAALAEITSQTLKPMNQAVMIALQSEDAEVRKNAIRDLTKIFDSFKQSGKMLGHAALDEDPDVKQTADWALDQLNKMKPSSSKAAGFLGESDQPQRRLTDDGHSSS